jgi:hypothetical protein
MITLTIYADARYQLVVLDIGIGIVCCDVSHMHREGELISSWMETGKTLSIPFEDAMTAIKVHESNVSRQL